MAGLRDQMIQMGLVFGTLHFIKKFKLDEPEYVQYIQAMYALSVCLLMATIFYLKTLVESKNDQSRLEYTEPQLGGQQTHVATTVKEYDLKDIKRVRNSTLTTAAVVLFMFWKFGFVQPMIFQTILPIFNMIKSPLFQIYLLGKPATGDLARPWRPENPFAPAASSNPPTVAHDGDSDSPSRIEELSSSSDEDGEPEHNNDNSEKKDEDKAN